MKYGTIRMMCIYVISYHVSLRTSNNELNEKRDFITLTIPIIEKYIVYILYIFFYYIIYSHIIREVNIIRSTNILYFYLNIEKIIIYHMMHAIK